MPLEKRELPFEVPQYSLTGDILSHQRCGLQYRYYSGSSLPPSRPVQLWTGEFVHGVLEEAYRIWSDGQHAFPWPCTVTKIPRVEEPSPRVPHDIGVIGDAVEARLAASGNRARSGDARNAAYARVEAAINDLGPALFPLITAAEERLSGTRQMPGEWSEERPARGDKYELTGIVDVISSVRLKEHADNPIVLLLQEYKSDFPETFDIIIDYKGVRRPPNSDRFRQHYLWQVRTYSWLRNRVFGVSPVAAGIVIYVNELAPLKTDLSDLFQDIKRGDTDIVPVEGSADYYALHRWDGKAELPELSQEFRLRRALHFIDVSTDLVDEAVTRIDEEVFNIELSATKEFVSGNIPDNWQKGGHDRDCVACDFKHFCPAPFDVREHHRKPKPPKAPG